jgi:hypothetical protein
MLNQSFTTLNVRKFDGACQVLTLFLKNALISLLISQTPLLVMIEGQHRRFELQAQLFVLLGRSIPRNVNHLANCGATAREGQRDLESVPASQFFLSSHANSQGTIGTPVTWAREMMPGCTLYFGPRGRPG